MRTVVEGARAQIVDSGLPLKLWAESISLAPVPEDYLPDAKDISAYKRFTGSVQWLGCQTRPDILQTVSKLSHHNMKPTEPVLERRHDT